MPDRRVYACSSGVAAGHSLFITYKFTVIAVI